MSGVPFHYVDLRAFCYATEDEKRVEQALRTFLPARGDDDPRDPIPLERETSEGFHGDRILVLSARLERADEVRYALSRLAEAEDFDRLLDEVESRVDDNCAFYVQLDKQVAFRGDVRLGEGLTFRAKVEAYPAKRETAIENARETLQSLREP
ncbi:RNA-binding protein [Salinirubellus salinus]|uniref:RNA-binding protein n=1 Tax=Salinirubellus salinus TaxID=1364945 RepID=A0A9E7R7C6_9EURY|nr:RNA-binding protein [Salinirubellus salinus]UWM56020.1 RNA-binding protein [Salinirubellus salinus]